MAKHPKCHLIQFFLLSYAAVVAAASTSTMPLPYYNQHNIPSNNPQPHAFPNERLYQAYLAIQRFKKTITCDPKNITSTWAGNDICGDKTYIGFYCATVPHPHHGNILTVTLADLNDFGLCAPKLQGLVDHLPDLALFHASSNKFGAIDLLNPLAGLTYQYKLDVSGDQPAHQPLQRDIPLRRTAGFPWNSEKDLLPIKEVVNKKYFCIANHLLCGKVGARSESLVAVPVPGGTNARALLLNNDNISGPLPANIGFSKLSYLALANNKLTGSIPPSVGNLQDSILEVLLLNNQLSGCIPHELGMLTKATVIDAGINQLTGPIPPSFSCLSSVEQLNLAGNRLYGHVPEGLCKLAGPSGRLDNLTLSGNYFTSVGPACGALINHGILDVKNNCIPGFASQRTPAECAAFHSQPKKCPAASTQVTCPTAASKDAAASGGRKGRGYYNYVTYATLYE